MARILWIISLLGTLFWPQLQAIYDPQLGRFLSADIVIEDANNLQSYNRYSYTQNRPLSATDPTGYWNIWNPLTYGIPNLPGQNSWSITDSSAYWKETARGANGGAEIYLNHLSGGLTDMAGITNSTAYKGDEFAVAHYAGYMGTAALAVGSGGAASSGNLIARGYILTLSAYGMVNGAQNIGGGLGYASVHPDDPAGYMQAGFGMLEFGFGAYGGFSTPAASTLDFQAPRSGLTTTVAEDASEYVTIYRGTNFRAEIEIFEESGAVLSDAGRAAYQTAIRSGASIEEALSIANEASQAAHAQQITSWGSLDNYVQAHGAFGQEVSEIAPRSLISFTTDPNAASRFGNTIFSFRVPRSMLTPQTLEGAAESEVLITNSIRR